VFVFSTKHGNPELILELINQKR